VVINMPVLKEADSNNTLNMHKKSERKIRLNMVLQAEAAKILFELKNRGIVRSYADGVNQAILLFYDKIIRQDLLSARLKALEKGFNENEFVGAE